MMLRDEALKVLARHRTDEIVIPVFQAVFEWLEYSPSELNFPGVRTMGEHASFALGLALARPDKRVILLNGDGSLLMNLGHLVTLAQAAPPNFIHFLLENEQYETPGGQPIPGAGQISFATIARGAGLKKVYEFEELVDFERELPRILKEEGPIFAVLKAVAGERQSRGRMWSVLHGEKAPEFRRSFRAALGVDRK